MRNHVFYESIRLQKAKLLPIVILPFLIVNPIGVSKYTGNVLPSKNKYKYIDRFQRRIYYSWHLLNTVIGTFARQPTAVAHVRQQGVTNRVRISSIYSLFRAWREYRTTSRFCQNRHSRMRFQLV